MANRILLLPICLFISSFTVQAQNSRIVPRPVIEQPLKGADIQLTAASVIYFDGAFARQATYLQQQLLAQLGFAGTVKSLGGTPVSGSIYLKKATQQMPHPEMYRLEVNGTAIQIEAADVRGIVNGIQTLLQLLPLQKTSKATIARIYIEDYPRFAYRGMHLDVVRHFFPVPYVKKYIDYLTFHKFNTFHWHLTDDQGWRIEMKSYPKLNTIGSWRDSTLIGHFKATPVRYDGKRYGGYYTKKEVQEIVDYATVRGITVIPELDIPGHSRATIAAYPELSTKPDTTWNVATTWGMYNRQNNVLAPKPATFLFLQRVFAELADMFPAQYIHLGGDECSKLWWKADSVTQRFMRSNGLKNETALQTYFIEQTAGYLKQLGRRTIGWHEVIEGKLDTSTIVMNWGDDKKAIEAAARGYSIIMTPGKPYYFDHYQSKDPADSLAIHGYNPLEAVYNYDPVPKALAARNLAYKVIGGQGNVWTEYMEFPTKVDYMVFPRMTALCEALWVQPERKNYTDFLRRIHATVIPRYQYWQSSWFKSFAQWGADK